MTFSSRFSRYRGAQLCSKRARRSDSTIMNRAGYSLLAAALLAITQPSHAETLRCGTKLVREGDLAIQVREKCGDPISEELLGYTLRGAPPGVRGEREYKIEQWIYGPDQGYYHVLIFQAGRLDSIDNVKQ